MVAIISAGSTDEFSVTSVGHTDTNPIVNAPTLIKILTITLKEK